ncbi:hypothetical protein [Marinifilum flexuosum]|uniref:hypothetical protein n=1 Tax=Marinifilum flexuosum TaxID=1117708 RepID=UPI000E719877|nr:hypothetical protein [Marinifilum flexuosum]
MKCIFVPAACRNKNTLLKILPASCRKKNTPCIILPAGCRKENTPCEILPAGCREENTPRNSVLYKLYEFEKNAFRKFWLFLKLDNKNKRLWILTIRM